jgi:uncharacterized protein YukE
MGDGLHAHPAELRTAALQFADDGVDLWAALGRLQSSLDGLGSMCGEDAPGRLFATAYEPNRRSIEAALGNLARGLAGLHDDLADLADNYEHTDRGASEALRVSGGRH